MKKFFNTMLFLGFFLGLYATAQAGVNFIVQPSKGGHQSNRIPTINMCAKRGFNMTSCGDNAFPNKSCVFEGRKYYDRCCDKNVYKYSGFAACANEGLKLGDMCGGKYSCIQQ